MRAWIGFLLIGIGYSTGISFFAEWIYQKEEIQYLTDQELSEYHEVQAESAAPAPEQTPALPASQVNHEAGAKVATLVIPGIEQKYSIYWGADDQTLTKGVGLYVSDLTTPPNGNGHTVLSGHRDTVFTNLGELKEQDQLIVKYGGETYVYQINKIWITDKDDRTVIVQKDEPVLTLITCYPFTYIGPAPDRYIIQAVPVSANQTESSLSSQT